jgi:hypothetical protein
MADNAIDTAELAASAVETAKINNAAVTADKLASNAVTTVKINADAVTSAKIADDAVDTEHIADDAIEEEHIGDGEVKTAAIANSNVTLAKLANIADDRVLGNISGSAAAPAELTAANLRTLLTVADGSLTTNDFTNADHSKLDGIAASANNYVHPNHSGEVTSNADGATTIANGAVVADRIAADAVITAKILNANVTTAKIAADAVTSAKIADDAVDTEHIADDAIEEEHIGDGEVKTAAIGDEQVTLAKMANMATSRVLGRISSNAGVPEVLTAANIRTILGVADGSLTTNDFTNADHSKLNGIEASATIDQTASEILTLIEDGVDSVHYKDASIDAEHLAADAVTTAKILNANVTLAKMANIADDTMLGNISGSAAAPAAMSIANVHTLIGEATGSITGLMSTAHHDKLDGITASAVSAAEAIAAVEGEATLDLTGLVTIVDSGTAGTDALLKLSSAADSSRMIIEADTDIKVPILHFRDTEGNANLNDSAVLYLDRNADIIHYEDGVGSAQNDFIISNGIADKDIHFGTNTGSTNTAATIKATLKHDGGFQFRASVGVVTSDPSPAISATGTIYQFTKGSAGTFTLPVNPPVGTQFVLMNMTTNDIVITRPASGVKINGATANKTNTTQFAATSIVAVVTGTNAEWLVFGGI